MESAESLLLQPVNQQFNVKKKKSPCSLCNHRHQTPPEFSPIPPQSPSRKGASLSLLLYKSLFRQSRSKASKRAVRDSEAQRTNVGFLPPVGQRSVFCAWAKLLKVLPLSSGRSKSSLCCQNKQAASHWKENSSLAIKSICILLFETITNPLLCVLRVWFPCTSRGPIHFTIYKDFGRKGAKSIGGSFPFCFLVELWCRWV